MEKLLTYGLLDEELIHVSKVKNGLACNCICAKCKQPLVAKNNPKNKKLAHFAHYTDTDIECQGAYETALHLLAKAILLKTKQFYLPDYYFDYDQFNSKSIFKKGEVVTFDQVIKDGQQVIVDNEKIIPDSIGIINKKQIFIEFAKTHFVDRDKMEKIKKTGIACIEIDLREQILDENLLTIFLTSRSSLIYWIFNPRMDREYKIMQQNLLAQQQQQENEEKIKLAKQKAEQDKKINEAYANLKLYKNKEGIKIFSRNVDGKLNKCPKKIDALNEFKSSKLYQHKILKTIIDGEFWNGKFYGNRPNGKWIFLKEEKVFVYPPDIQRENETEQDKKLFDFFYSGLHQILEAITNYEIGACRTCECSVDSIIINTKCYEVCKHPKIN